MDVRFQRQQVGDVEEGRGRVAAPQASRAGAYGCFVLGCLGTGLAVSMAGLTSYVAGYYARQSSCELYLYAPRDCYPYQTDDYVPVAQSGTAFKYPTPMGELCDYRGPFENYSFYTFHQEDNKTNRVLYVAQILGESEPHARQRAINYLFADYPIRFYPLTLTSGQYCFNELGSFSEYDPNFIHRCEQPSAFSLPKESEAWGLIRLHDSRNTMFANKKQSRPAQVINKDDLDMANSPFAQSDTARKLRASGR